MSRGPFALFIGLNPSTADDRTNDPTITREMAIVSGWGFTELPPFDYVGNDRTRRLLTRPGLAKMNLFDARSTDPKGLLGRSSPGAANLYLLAEVAQQAPMVVCAWGGPYAPKPLRELVQRRADEVVVRLRDAGIRTLHCLGKTRGGHPRHPLYMPKDSQPIVWRELGGDR